MTKKQPKITFGKFSKALKALIADALYPKAPEVAPEPSPEPVPTLDAEVAPASALGDEWHASMDKVAAALIPTIPGLVEAFQAPSDSPENGCSHCGRDVAGDLMIEAVAVVGMPGMYCDSAAIPRGRIERSQGCFPVGPTCAKKLAKKGVTIIDPGESGNGRDDRTTARRTHSGSRRTRRRHH